MPYVKMPKEYVSAQRRKAARSRKNPGRPKGSKNKNPYGRRDDISPHEPRVTMTMLQSTQRTFAKCANADGTTMIAFLRKVADWLRTSETYAHLFAPEQGARAGTVRA